MRVHGHEADSSGRILLFHILMNRNEAFKSSVVGMQGNLRTFALKLTMDKDEADDLVQDTMLRALNNEAKFVEGTNLKGWMLTIMRNIYINNCRRGVKETASVNLPDTLSHVQLSADSGIETPEGAFAVNEISALLADFPADYRKPFSMFVAGYKYEEISSALDMPLGTVKSRIFFTRKRMRELLKDYR